MRRVGTAGLLAVGVALLGAAPGQAQELPGGTYFGKYAGGAVKLKVSPSGTRLAEFVVTNEQGEICASGPWPSFPPPAAPGLPIENHAFAGALSPYLWIGGSFTAPGMTSGSFDLSPFPPGRFGGGLPAHCPSEPTSWSAVGDATAPALVMNSRATQPRGHKTVKVRFSCAGEACTALAQGVVSVRAPGVERRFRLLSAGAPELSGETTLKLAIPLRAYHTIRALDSAGSVIARVRLTVSDAFENVTEARESITLR